MTRVSFAGQLIVRTIRSWSTLCVIGLSGPLFGFQGSTIAVSVDAGGLHGNDASFGQSISADGRFVAFASRAYNLVPGDTNQAPDVFVRDTGSGTIERVSVTSAGAQGENSSGVPSISADGRWVAFYSTAVLDPADATLHSSDIYLHDRATGTTTLVPPAWNGAQGQYGADWPWISGDGQFIGFTSGSSNLVPNDTNDSVDTFVRDLAAGTTTRVSVDSLGGESGGGSGKPFISHDGRFVVYASWASNLVAGDTNAKIDVLVHDRSTGTTTRESIGSAGQEGNDHSGARYWSGNFDLARPSISDDGRYVAFYSLATNLVAGDSNGVADVFVRDRQLGTTTRVSVGLGGVPGNEISLEPSLSADGRFIAFWSLASNLVSGDTNLWDDVFVLDRQTGAMRLASPGVGGQPANFNSSMPDMARDGRYVVYQSNAWNLVPNDTNGSAADVFVNDSGGTTLTALCVADGSDAQVAALCPCFNLGSLGRGCDNSTGTGGAQLLASGLTSPDTIVLSASGLLSSSLAIFLQGNQQLTTPLTFGDGVRCIGGSLKRLYVKNAIGGTVSAPQAGDPAITQVSANLGDPVAAGSVRYYQVYYRDPDLMFCPNPPGNSFNVSNGLSIGW